MKKNRLWGLPVLVLLALVFLALTTTAAAVETSQTIDFTKAYTSGAYYPSTTHFKVTCHVGYDGSSTPGAILRNNGSEIFITSKDSTAIKRIKLVYSQVNNQAALNDLTLRRPEGEFTFSSDKTVITLSPPLTYVDIWACTSYKDIVAYVSSATIYYDLDVGVSLSDSKKELSKGENFALTATVTPDELADKTVIWSVDNGTDAVKLYSDSACTSEVSLGTATDTRTVYVKATAHGKETVTATSNTDRKSASCSVNIPHNFAYTANGATITVTCQEDGCPLSGKPPELKIVAPTLETYHGEGSPEATLTGLEELNAATGLTLSPVIKYYKADRDNGIYTKTGGALSGAPTDAGVYLAEITVNGATASVGYKIYKTNPIAKSPTVSVATYGQMRSELTLTNPEGNTPGTWVFVTDGSVGDVGRNGFSVYFKPTDSSNYFSAKGWVNVTVLQADNPATVESPEYVKMGGNTVNLAGSVHLNGAKGEVSYAFSGGDKGCSLKGSVLTSGTKTGSVTVKVTVAEEKNYKAGTSIITVNITEKDIQILSVEEVEATYGDTDKRVTAVRNYPATGGGKISYAVKPGSEDYIDVDAATGALTIKKVPANGKAYVIATAAETKDYAPEKEEATIEISKADPVAAAPSAKATCGQKLSEVELINPEGNTEGTWSWADSMANAAGEDETWDSEVRVGEEGVHVFEANFTPRDTTNYNRVTGVNVRVTVGRGENPATIEGTEYVRMGGYTVDLAHCVHLFGATGAVSYAISGEAKGCSLNGSVLTSGDQAGSVTVNVTVAADSNYQALEAKPITVTITEKDIQRISADNVTATFGDTDKSISATTDGDGAISFAVKSGSEEYIDVDASTGALTIKSVPAKGKAHVVVTASETENCAQVTEEVTILIRKAKSTPATVTANNRTCDGAEQPLVTVTGEAAGGTMKYATGPDETTAPAAKFYADAIPTGTEAGTYYVWYKVVGDGNHNDTAPACVTVEITKGEAPKKTDISKAKISIEDQEYTGKAIKPKLTVKVNGKKLKANTDYTVSFKNNKSIGKATATITGKGKYTGKKTATFSIVPKKIASVSLQYQKKEKTLTVSWKKASGIDGYEIEYGTDKKFKGAKKVTVSAKEKKTEYVIKKLKTKKMYYVRIRAWKKVKGKKYYSEWSKAVSKKVK